jgi:hypothetical protein
MGGLVENNEQRTALFYHELSAQLLGADGHTVNALLSLWEEYNKAKSLKLSP